MRNFLILMTVLFAVGCKKNSIIPPPVSPSLLAVSAASTTQINLSWTDNSTNEDGFKIERKTGTANFSEIGSIGKDVTSFSDVGLTKNTTYTYRVYAYNTGGKSMSYTNEASATTLDDLPAAATNLTANAVSYSQINLTWEDNASNETGYKLERKTGSGAFSLVASLGVNTTSYNDNGLAESTVYTYRIYPFNASGNGNNSNDAKDTTFADITTGLMVYYPFSGNSQDVSGNGKNAVAFGATLTMDRFGIPNMAYNFIQNSDIIKLDNSGITPQNFTVSLWCKVSSTWSYTSFSMVTIGPSDNTSSSGINLSIDQNDVYGAGKYKIIGNVTTTNLNVVRSNSYDFSTLNKWRHYVFTKDNTMMKLYIDGILESTINISGTINYSQTNLRIGNQNNINNLIAGQRMIDEVRVFNRALSQEQISFLSTR